MSTDHDDLEINPRQSIVRLLKEAPPRRLRCFGSDEDWHKYLLMAHEGGDRVVRRQDTGKHRGNRKVITIFDERVRQLPCDDCHEEYMARMKAVGRCEKVSPGNAARKWLKALLSSGPLLASEIRRVANAQGFSSRTIFRVAGRLGVVRTRTDHTRPETALWALPRQDEIAKF
jgi:hypothetical protein